MRPATRVPPDRSCTCRRERAALEAEFDEHEEPAAGEESRDAVEAASGLAPGERCQRCIVAATLPSYGLKSIDSLVGKYFADARRVATGDGSPLPMHATVETLSETWIQVGNSLDDKLEQLAPLIRPNERTMVFANTASAARVLIRVSRRNALSLDIRNQIC